ncbi:putative FKBP-type peptidyl-prolyl cis-trans isomerase [Rubripirellula tenax]|uniref:Peptidyl-prolyl cis-trans isomerase n=1 Tax=Rubripirellula tenax TaxID=2528015 RepID=A0A5C6FLE5_9BACT|nr:FKBP-type peptidyl-prolyl cis-trans isomerase [Rubripirellula tenax]TWU60372.1 putative FKBP-type peptidyl-prolyl cis-trans isomerase [Rubripirellula tenax]
MQNPISLLTRRFMLCIAALACLSAVSCSGPRRGPNEVDADAETEFTTTESGLKYRMLRKGSGKQPTANSRVKVDYAGWLDSGQFFDSSYDRSEPAEFGLDQVVAGWTEGLQYVKEGGMIELEVPSDLGYGPSGRPGIPPNATLHFKVELHEIR